MKHFVGTSGYNFDAWKGAFYPRDLPTDQWLGFYARHMTSVEINYTFYRNPSAATVAAWQAQVPDTFRLTVKANQKITHGSRLKDRETLAFFCSQVLPMGDRLGLMLVQTPPTLPNWLNRSSPKDFLKAATPTK